MGSVLGVAEHLARRRVSQGLEQAFDASELVPGERGWKRLAAGITEVCLTMSILDLRREHAGSGGGKGARGSLGRGIPRRASGPPDSDAAVAGRCGWGPSAGQRVPDTSALAARTYR